MYLMIKKNEKMHLEKALTHEDMRNILKALEAESNDKPWKPTDTLNKVRYVMNQGWKNSEEMNSIKTIEFIKTFHPTEELMYPVVVAKYDNKYYLLNTFAVASSSVPLVKEVTTEYPNGYHELLIDDAIDHDDFHTLRKTMIEFIQHFHQFKEVKQ